MCHSPITLMFGFGIIKAFYACGVYLSKYFKLFEESRNEAGFIL